MIYLLVIVYYCSMLRVLKYSIIFALVLLLVQPAIPGEFLIPVTYSLSEQETVEAQALDKNLTEFIIEHLNSDCNSVEGIYVQNKLLFSVVQQPGDQPGFVSSRTDTVTQFSYASQYDSIGLLAHNTLAGAEFFKLEPADEITLIYGDGHLAKYIITDIREFQALSPYSQYSTFIDLHMPEEELTYQELFFDTYGTGDNLVLQTCIAQKGVDSWGRLFIIASPVDAD